MQIEEVIAIAKTLRPGFTRALRFNDTTAISLKSEFALEYDAMRYYGHTWEEALRAAGWKG